MGTLGSFSREKQQDSEEMYTYEILTERHFSMTPSSVRVTLECGKIPKALFSARWLKCNSVLEEERREGGVNW